MQVSDDDYQPMESFALRWRWTNEYSPNLSVEERAHVRPLKPDPAKRAWDESLRFVSEGHDFRPCETLFPNVSSLDTSEREPEQVRDWLEACVPRGERLVVISWQPDLAVVTDHGLFVRYWDDFCYPGDDARIWPAGWGGAPDWVVHHWHEEVLYVAQAGDSAFEDCSSDRAA